MELELFLKFLNEYYLTHDDEVKNIIESYIESESMSINLEAFKEMLPAILVSLYNFIKTSSNVPEIIKKKVEEKEDDYTLLNEELVYIWTHAAIPLTLSWEKAPKDFTRRILVPLRSNLSDIMYAALSTMRSQLSEMVYLEGGEYSFVSQAEYNEDDEKTYLASDYAAYAIYELGNPKMCYGYLDAWVFDITLNHIRILDDKKAKMPLLLVDAKGFGIFEGNQENVISSIDNPMYQTRDSVKAKDMLGVDFTETSIEDMKETLVENFYLTQYRYEAAE